jgi:hypothetical protein
MVAPKDTLDHMDSLVESVGKASMDSKVYLALVDSLVLEMELPQ